MRQHPIAVLLVLIALPAAGVAIALTRGNENEAGTTLLLGPTVAQQAERGAAGLDGRAVATARELADSPAVAARAAVALPNTTPAELRGRRRGRVCGGRERPLDHRQR